MRERVQRLDRPLDKLHDRSGSRAHARGVRPSGYGDAMEEWALGVLQAIVGLFVAFTLGALLLALGVWFGLFILVPRIQRALHRAEPDEKEPGDRPD